MAGAPCSSTPSTPGGAAEVPCRRELGVANGAGEVGVSHEVALRALEAAAEGELVGELAGVGHVDPLWTARPL